MSCSIFSSKKRRMLVAVLALLVSVFGAGIHAGAQKQKRSTAAKQTQSDSGATEPSPVQAPSRQKSLTPLRSNDAPDGSRVTITSDGALSDYSAYRSGNRFYVVIPGADAPGAQSNMRGRGFEDVKVQKNGRDTVLSFRLQPGASARVSQKFNKLDVVFTTPDKAGEEASAVKTDARPAPVVTTPAQPTPAPGQSTANNQQAQSSQTTTPATDRGITARNTNQTNINADRRNAPPVTGEQPAQVAMPGDSVMQSASPSPSAPLEESASSPPATPAPTDQIAQVQATPSAPSATTSAPAATSVTVGAFLMRHWLPALIIGLLLLTIGLVVGTRAMSGRRAAPPPPLREKRESALREAPVAELDAASVDEATIVTPPPPPAVSPVPVARPEKVEITPVVDETLAAEEVPAVLSNTERAEAEVKNLLAGRAYDESVIGAYDRETRQVIATALLVGLARRDVEQRQRAHDAFIKYGYLEEATYDLRTAKTPAERASAARSLGLVREAASTPHLIAALQDASAEVRRAAVEALTEMGDPAAVAPLKALLKREKSHKADKSRKVPPTLIQRAIKASTTGVKEAATPTAATATPAAEASAAIAEPEAVETVEAPAVAESVQPGAIVEEPAREAIEATEPIAATADLSATEFPREAETDAATAQSILAAEIAAAEAAASAERRRIEEEEAAERRWVEEEEARLRAEEEARLRAEAEARLRVEEEARVRAQEEERQRLEEEERQHAQAARLRAQEEERQRIEAEVRRRAEERAAEQRAIEEARRRAEEEARLRAEQEAARIRAQEEERRRAEEEARLLAEEEARQRAAEEERLRAEEERQRAEAARRQAEEEERQRVEAEARLRAEEEARLRAEAEARQRAEAEARLRAAEEARQRAEAEARIRAEEEAARQRAEEEERQRLEAEAARRRAEEEARLRAEQEAAQRREEEARQRAEEEARLLAEEEARRRAAEEARLRAEEAAAQQRAAEEARRRAEEEARLRAAEEARQRVEAEARQRAEAEARQRAEEEARVRAAEEARQRAEEEAAHIRAEGIPASHVVEAEVVAEDARPVEQLEFFESRTPETSSYVSPVEPLIERNEASAWIDIDISEPEIVHAEPPAGAVSITAEEETAVADTAPEEITFESALETVEPAIQPEVSPRPIVAEPIKEAPAAATVKAIDQAVTAEAEEEISLLPGAIFKRLKSNDANVRAAAVGDLARLGGEDSFRQISAVFDDPAPEVRDAAARALYDFHTDRAASFTRALREATPERRRNIGAALASSGLANEAIGHLTGQSREKTYDAFSLLFLMSKAGEVQPLMRAIEEHPNNEVRLAVVKLLALSGQQEILPAFRRLAVRGSLPTEVRSAVMEAIYQISSQASADTHSTV